MKKIFITLALTFLFFFLFFPNNTYALEIPEDIEEKELTCNSEDLEFCSGFSYRYAFWDSSLSSYKDSGSNDGYTPGYYMFFAPGYKFDVDVGPSTMYPAYIYQIGANSYDYDFERGKIYRIYYYFSFQKDLQLLDNIYDYKYDWSTFSVKGTDGKDYDDYIDFLSRFNYGLESYTPETPDNKFHFVLYFEFEPSISFTNLSFKLGTEHFNNDNVLKFISNPWTSSEVFTYNISYDNFKIVETSSFLSSSGIDHGGGGIDLDKPSQSDTDIFDNLDTCETTDFGCHFNNLLTMLKNVFTRIGNFFTSIFNFLNDGINTVLQWFYETFLKNPFDAMLNFFETMFSTKILGIDIFLDKLEELVQPSEDGITSIITAPLSYIKSLSNGVATCSSISLPLVSWFNKDLILPCPSTIYSKFGSFLTIYQTITTGIIAYWCLVNILSLTLQFKEPFSDKIEVMDL